MNVYGNAEKHLIQGVLHAYLKRCKPLGHGIVTLDIFVLFVECGTVSLLLRGKVYGVLDSLEFEYGNEKHKT